MKRIIFASFIILAILASCTTCTTNKKNNAAQINIQTTTPALKAEEKLQVKESDKPQLATSNINQTKQVVTVKPSVKNKKKVIVIDPGHASKSNLQLEAIAPSSSEMKIKDGGGAQGIISKTPEYLVNMRVSLKLKPLLESKGYTVIMTKTSNSLSLGNIERANVGNNANANLVIRIHADSNDNGQVMGASMLVPAAINDNTKNIYAESKRCGIIVLDTLVREVGMKNRGVVVHSDMTGFNWSKVPVILVEMGFLSNSTEDRLLCSDNYENKLAQGLADGIALAEN